MVDRSTPERLSKKARALAGFRYGNWTGGGYGGGLFWLEGEHFTSDVLLNVAPTDSFDALSRWHDIAYDNAQLRYAIDLTLGVQRDLAVARFNLGLFYSDRVYIAQMPYFYAAGNNEAETFRALALTAFVGKASTHRSRIRSLFRKIEDGKIEEPSPELRSEADAIRTLFERGNGASMHCLDGPNEILTFHTQPFLKDSFYLHFARTYADPSEGPLSGPDGRFLTINADTLRGLEAEYDGWDASGRVRWTDDALSYRHDTMSVAAFDDATTKRYIGVAEFNRRVRTDPDAGP